MRAFPFWNSGNVEVSLGSQVRADCLPQAIATFLEGAGFAISELNEYQVSFEMDRTPRIGFRWPGSLWTQVTGGRVLVRLRGKKVELNYQLSFVYFTLLMLFNSIVFAVVTFFFAETFGLLKALGLLVLISLTHCMAIASATEKFGKFAAQYLTENQVRYV